MTRGQISNVLRQLGLIYFTDWVRYYIERYRNRKVNKDFKKTNPDVKLPPDYLIYESFQINYKKYYTESKDTAQCIANYFSKYIPLQDKKILDWGCGPGRVIRHLPSVIGNGCEYYGTDYNKLSIDWCSKNLPDIKFNNNSVEAELPYSNNFFDIIYGISIFTHLPEQLLHDWYIELLRILKPNGIMLLTTQGDNFKVKLIGSELNKYNNGHIVVRGKVKVGHRTFSAFHPTKFMEKFFANVEILEHVVTKPEKGKKLPQDIWIIKK
jgi:SAM-dependent methyltransferase